MSRERQRECRVNASVYASDSPSLYASVSFSDNVSVSVSVARTGVAYLRVAPPEKFLA